MKFYPLQFYPILKERIWGGTKLKTYLNKPSSSDITGESWEISTIENDVSIVINGIFSGKSLNQLIEEFPTEILGTLVYKRFGKQFPLLFKYLDAREDLSIQLHPNDALAKKRHNSFGKTEMWYVMQADHDARLIVSFKHKSNPKEYLRNIKNKSILDILDTKKVSQGDVFFLETGTIHAIGAGVVIAEIQQTSDITYRIYDFERKDANGNERQLHNDLALEAINFEVIEAEKKYSKYKNKPNEIVNCKYFTTNFIPLDGKFEIAINQQTFRVYMCVDGHFELICDQIEYQYQKGDTILIPASMNTFEISGKASVLEIYIK